MAITKMRFSQFTAFAELDFIASLGINVLVGANGTGKTHLIAILNDLKDFLLFYIFPFCWLLSLFFRIVF